MEGWIHYYTIDEFATDADFREWVASGEFGKPEHTYTQFLRTHPHLYPLAQQAADFLRVTAVREEELPSYEVNRQIRLTWQKIRRTDRQRITPIRFLWQYKAVAAAMVVLLGGLSWWLSHPAQTPSLAVADSNRITLNQQTTLKPLSLSDGSVVWLTPGSTLRYPAKFAVGRREVSLTGSAFFEIHKNAGQPFYVKTRDLITRVVGTSFFVKELPKQAGTLVQVRTGKVLVYRNSAQNAVGQRPIALKANEEVQVRANQSYLTTEAVRQPVKLSERLNEQRLEFTDTPLSEVLKALSKAYDLPVDYDPVTFRNCQITTDLSDEPLAEKLTILAETIGPGTRMELIGDRIRLSGPGCF